jgi:hypothetical protein
MFITGEERSVLMTTAWVNEEITVGLLFDTFWVTGDMLRIFLFQVIEMEAG